MNSKLYAATGSDVSITTLCRTLHRIGFTRKKIQHIVLQQDEQARMEFMNEMKLFDADMILWLDETGSDRWNSLRKFGYSLRGLTPVEYSLSTGGCRISAIAVMSIFKIEDYELYEDNVNGDMFCSFLSRCVLPILNPFNGTNTNSVIILDNASIHHVSNIINTVDCFLMELQQTRVLQLKRVIIDSNRPAEV